MCPLFIRLISLPNNKVVIFQPTKNHGTTAGLLLWWRQTKGAKHWTWLQWSFDKGLEALLLLFWPYRLLVAGLNQWLFLKDSYGFLRSLCGISGFLRVLENEDDMKKVGVFCFSKLLFKGNTEGWRGPPVFWWISKVRISTWSFFWPVGLLVELYGST